MSAMTDQVPSDAKPKPVRRRRSRARLAEASMLPVVWVLLIVVFSVAEPSKFFTHADFAGIALHLDNGSHLFERRKPMLQLRAPRPLLAPNSGKTPVAGSYTQMAHRR